MCNWKPARFLNVFKASLQTRDRSVSTSDHELCLCRVHRIYGHVLIRGAGLRQLELGTGEIKARGKKPLSGAFGRVILIFTHVIGKWYEFSLPEQPYSCKPCTSGQWRYLVAAEIPFVVICLYLSFQTVHVNVQRCQHRVKKLHCIVDCHAKWWQVSYSSIIGRSYPTQMNVTLLWSIWIATEQFRGRAVGVLESNSVHQLEIFFAHNRTLHSRVHTCAMQTYRSAAHTFQASTYSAQGYSWRCKGAGEQLKVYLIKPADGGSFQDKQSYHNYRMLHCDVRVDIGNVVIMPRRSARKSRTWG